MHPIDHIRKFANITPKIEDNLRKVMQEHHPHKGEMIQGANNLITYAYYLASGSARVYYIERERNIPWLSRSTTSLSLCPVIL